MNQTYAFRTSGAHLLQLISFILNHMIRCAPSSQVISFSIHDSHSDNRQLLMQAHLSGLGSSEAP